MERKKLKVEQIRRIKTVTTMSLSHVLSSQAPCLHYKFLGKWTEVAQRQDALIPGSRQIVTSTRQSRRRTYCGNLSVWRMWLTLYGTSHAAKPGHSISIGDKLLTCNALPF